MRVPNHPSVVYPRFLGGATAVRQDVGMKTSRAEAVVRELRALAHAAEAAHEVTEATCSALGKAIPFEFACLATTDPATRLITGAYKSQPADSLDSEFARLEYAIEDINQFHDLAARTTPVGVLEHDTAGHPDRCVRYREFLVPCFSHGHELRAAFRSTHGVWGVIGMYRPVGQSGFSDEEAEFLAMVSSTVAEGLSAAAIRQAATVDSPGGPAVLILTSDDQPAAMTPALEKYLDRLAGAGKALLPMPVLAIAAAVRARRAGLPAPEPRASLRTPFGDWLTLAGAPLAASRGNDADVIVTIDQAQPADIVTATVSALGLTTRERDVVQLVLAGHSTSEIATRLKLSAYTVQDHLKAIFDKAGVRTRRQLVATLFHRHYAPSLGQPINHRGWFSSPAEPPGG